MTQPDKPYHVFDKNWISQNYDKFRPTYPPSLIQQVMDYLKQGINQQDKFDLAIDVGCGPGTSTQQYAPYFNRIIGFDHSATQIDLARQDNHDPNITYQLSPAENLPLEDNIVDLVICAQAIHWFNIDRFLSEVNRVLKPGTGCVALYAYNDPVIMNCDQAEELNYYIYNGPLSVETYQFAKYCGKCRYSNIEWPFSQAVRGESNTVDNQMDIDSYIGLLHTYGDSVDAELPYPDPELKRSYPLLNESDQEHMIIGTFAEMLRESTGGEMLQLCYPFFYMFGKKPSKL
ncbi:putative methyltransferase [Trichoplax sp. H2]|nr:putative methyltransferase [Trichoplax sp. H2]|eukprot:RDD41849.1 putative methyltransferase [Trichoplax sp. H2]